MSYGHFWITNFDLNTILQHILAAPSQLLDIKINEKVKRFFVFLSEINRWAVPWHYRYAEASVTHEHAYIIDLNGWQDNHRNARRIPSILLLLHLLLYHQEKSRHVTNE